MRYGLLLIASLLTVASQKIYTQEAQTPPDLQQLLDSPDNFPLEEIRKTGTPEIIVPRPMPPDMIEEKKPPENVADEQPQKPAPEAKTEPEVKTEAVHETKPAQGTPGETADEIKPEASPGTKPENQPEKTPETAPAAKTGNEAKKPVTRTYGPEFQCYRELAYFGADNLLDSDVIIIPDRNDLRFFYVFSVDECVKYKLPGESTHSDTVTDTYHVKLVKPAAARLAYKVTGNVSAKYIEDFPIIKPVVLEEVSVDNPKQVLQNELASLITTIFSKYQESKKSSTSMINRKRCMNTLGVCARIPELVPAVKKERHKFR
ncbi:MAG: hypothetical protein JXA66_04360 [Oligoflexia bacterium]|nr:hypothetical protein [Oligoflexia bacterium]